MVPSRLIVVLSLLLAAAGAARAQEDTLLLPGEKVRTALGAGQSRTVGVAGVEGGRYTISVRATPQSGAAPTFQVIAPDGADLGDRGRIRTSARSAVVKNAALDRTGVWRVTISTPAGRGGEVELSVKAKLPRARKLVGETAGDPGTATLSFPALAGSTADLELAFLRRSAMDVTLRAPGTTEPLAAASGAKGSVRLRGVAISAFGVHEVQVDGAGGPFRGKVRIRGPVKRKDLAFDAVEALPVVTGMTPASVPNDGRRTLEFDGYGFSSALRLQLSRDGAAALSTPIGAIGPSSAQVTADLEGIPSAVFDVALRLPSGRRLPLPWTLDVTNFPAVVLTETPSEASHESDVALRLDGAGFDPGAAVEVRRSSDGLEIPVVSTTRTNHRVLEATLRAPRYAVGPCDVLVLDGDGKKTPRPAALDLLGESGPSADVRTVASPRYADRAVAYDDAAGRLVVSVSERDRIAFVLVETSTWDVLDVYEPALSSPTGRQMHPRAAFHPRDGTWALGWTDGAPAGGNQRGYLRITGRNDLDDVRYHATVASGKWVDFVTPVPDAPAGGWHAYWIDTDASDVDTLRLLRVGADGTPVAGGPATLATDGVPGLLFWPDAAQLADGRFVVVFHSILFPEGGGSEAVLERMVLDPGGSTSLGRLVCADGDDFENVALPRIAAHPTDGSACVAFTGYLAESSQPAAVRLGAGKVEPDPVRVLGPRDLAAETFVTGIVWNEERREYVVSVERSEHSVSLRRIDEDGRVLPVATVSSYEGANGVVWAGRSAGGLGLVRLFDGTADGYHILSVSSFQTLCTPLR